MFEQCDGIDRSWVQGSGSGYSRSGAGHTPEARTGGRGQIQGYEMEGTEECGEAQVPYSFVNRVGSILGSIGSAVGRAASLGAKQSRPTGSAGLSVL